MTTPTSDDLSAKPLPSTSRLALRLLALLVILGLLLFLPAGTLRWVEGWIFVVAYGGFLCFYLIQVLAKDPEQLQERSHAGPNIKKWDKTIMKVYSALIPITLIVSGLDAVRFRWVHGNLPLEIAAWIGLTIAGGIIYWATATNTYLSRMARIQEDRGQVVVSSGPYRFVRHPMYSGIILLFICMPLALGSGWGLVPGIIIGFLFIVRTYKEDQMLRQELGGYEDYAQQVRYRLVPGIW